MNTRSIKQGKPVAVDDASVYILWEVLCIEWQGYNIESNILYQENKSAIMLGVNGKMSLDKRSRALNIIIFLWQIKLKILQTKYCPTYKTWKYFTTNPTQGAKLRSFRNYVLGGNK